ncbi:MAG: pseudouridine synthase, partial [Mycobacterium leprae]
MDEGRPAGKPVKGPAGPRMVGGVDRKTMEELEEKGLLTGAGKRMLHSGEVPRSKGPAAKSAGLKVAQGARPVARPGARVPGAFGKRGAETAAEAAGERLHKVMAQAGLASRRHSEELIQAGRVTVNGQVVTQLGTKVVPGKDRIEVDGRLLGKPEDLVYILLNKPKGYVTTLFDPEGRPKVVDLLGEEIGQRVYPVGRLDYDTEGLLLLTNDGDLANAIMHPAREVKKTYIGKVRGVPGPAKLRALETGIELEDGMTAPAEVKLLEAKGPNAATVSIRIHEGRNRQVRRMFEAVGHEVIHLRRTTLGPLSLKDMEVGQWRELSPYEVSDLRKSVGLSPEEKATGRGGKGRKGAPVARRGGFTPRPAAREEGVEASAFPTPAGRPVAGLPGKIARPDGPGRPTGAGRGYGGDRPDGDRPRYGAGRPGGAGRPYGGDRPDGERPRYGAGRPGGAGRPYGGDRPDGERPRFGGGRPGGDRPDGERPRFGGGRPGGAGRPYGGDRPDGERPRFGG